jgi:hypothetical protein
MLQNCWLLKVRQKGLDTIGKRAQLKVRRKRAPKRMNMHECKLPLNKCISPKDSSLDSKLPLEIWIGYSPLLVMHESSLQMQACASQIYKEN